MQTTFIYGLICPKKNQIMYIGKADDVKRRLRQHIHQSKSFKNSKNIWINNLLKENLKPEIEVIDKVELKDWGYWEDFWIKYYRFLGVELLNEMSGGHGYGKHSQETIEKIRQSQSGEKNAMYGKPGIKGMLGKKLSTESRKKISDAKKGKFTGDKNNMYGKTHTEESRKKISEANKIKKGPRSEETKKKISEALKGEKNKNTGKTYEQIYGAEKAREIREQLRMASIGKKVSEETKEKLRLINTGKKVSEETKKKMSEKSKGLNNGFYGKKHSLETIEKMKLSHNKNKKSIDK